MSYKIYIDSNIFVAYFCNGRLKEQKNKDAIIKIFKLLKTIEGIEYYMSNWTITEFVKVMINTKKEGNKEVNKIANNLTKKAIIEDVVINILETSPSPGYGFNDFFYDVREKITLYNTGWADTIHQVIMKNNEIKFIITIDAKDFEIIPGIIVINPLNQVENG